MKKIFSVIALTTAFTAMCGCSLFQVEEEKSDVAVKIYLPDGAPALALAKLMHDDVQYDGVEYYVVDAKTIASRVTNADMTRNADICVMPITAASKLLGTGDTYKMLGLATQGNLFLLSQTEQTEITTANLQTLLGKTVVVAQMNEVPGLTLKAVLQQNNVAWQELKEGVEPSANKVNLAVAAETFDYELVAEPAVSKRLSNTSVARPWKVVGDIQKLYGGEANYGFPQAAIVAKSALVKGSEEWIKEFLVDVVLAQNWLVEENASAIYQAVTSHFEDKGKTPVFAENTLSTATLSRCGVQFALASLSKLKVYHYLGNLSKINPNAVGSIVEEFFWDCTALAVPD